MTDADISEKERIWDRIRHAKSRDDLLQIVEEEREAKNALAARPDCGVFDIHLKNLVNYRLASIKADKKG